MRKSQLSNRRHLAPGAQEAPSELGSPQHLSRKSHPEDDFKVLTAGDHDQDHFIRGSLRANRKCIVWLGFLLFFICSCFLLLKHDPIKDDGEGFVTVSGLQFVKDCRPFFVAGFNSHNAVTGAMLTPSEYKVAGGKSGKDQIREMFGKAAQSGLSVIRTWVHTDDPQFPFQVSPGEYNPAALRALDYVLEEARRNGLKVLLCLIDNWKYYNGIDQYVDWSTTAPKRTHDRPHDKWGDANIWVDLDDEVKSYEVARHALFFTDAGCKKMYKDHVATIVNRQNSFSGRIYRDDPTIFAWDLLNEPRCETWKSPACARYLQNWVEEMSSYLKSLDPNHLVTIGSEGFFKKGAGQDYLNPEKWAGTLGQDYQLNHLPKTIDFSTIHVWPDTWGRTEENFESNWIMSHVDTASFQLGKPVLVEEFGKKLLPNRHNPSSIRVLRDPVFKSTFNLVENLIAEGRAVGGSMFWKWDLPMFHGSDRSEYGVSPGDTTFQLVTQHATFVNQWINSQPPEPSCDVECWVPFTGWYSRQCQNIPELCSVYWNVIEEAKNGTRSTREVQETRFLVKDRVISLAGLQVFPSRSMCCRSGLGAFAKGCSWTTWVWS